jgi:cobalt-precorrin 5A hydrolase
LSGKDDNGALEARGKGAMDARGQGAADPPGENRPPGPAVYALTVQGAALAKKIALALGGTLCLPRRLAGEPRSSPGGPARVEAVPFDRLGDCLKKNFRNHSGHALVAATGLVVRLVAPLLRDKKTDPAVVALGHDGRHVVSLLSGHLGGADRLARQVALVTGGTAVVNTATDLEGVPSLEVLAGDLGLKAPDLRPLAAVSRMLAEGRPVGVHDPGGWLAETAGAYPHLLRPLADPPEPDAPAVSVHWLAPDNPAADKVLRLYPPVLAVGVGCHRDCPQGELEELVKKTLAEAGLSFHAIGLLATADIRAGRDLAPAGLAGKLGVPLAAYGPAELNSVETPTPSEVVFQRIGASSVCEASARLAARMGPLLAKKKKSARATCAAALVAC